MGPKNFNNTVDQHKLGTNLISSIKSDVSDLKTTVGDSDSGLVKDIDDLNNVITSIPIVTANPEDQATDTLSSLKIDNVVYGISSGGESSNVEIIEMDVNPLDINQRVFKSGTSFTDILNAIEAGKVIFIKCQGLTSSQTCYLQLTTITAVSSSTTRYFFTSITNEGGRKYLELLFEKYNSYLPEYGDFSSASITTS